MSTVSTSPRATEDSVTPRRHSLTEGQKPGWTWMAVAAAAAVVAAGLTVLLSGAFNVVGFVIIAAILYIAGLYVATRVMENRRRAADGLCRNLVWLAFLVALVPLVSVLWSVLSAGLPTLIANPQIMAYDMKGITGIDDSAWVEDGKPAGGLAGGFGHALIGTVVITIIATLISVPIGMLTSIYLVEYSRGGWFSRAIVFFVDVMTGIPSIVAGLFAYALFVVFFGEGVRMGIGGSVALSVLMIPVVVRSCEEMLKLVPNELREASYALGVPKWRTITKVVLPTALAGIVTGITLAIARVIGETAPLLIIAGMTDSVNFNLFDGRMATLPVFAYTSIRNPGVPPEFALERAWGAALVLLIIVMLLNLAARLVSYFFSPKGER